jgi:hypothetical protein
MSIFDIDLQNWTNFAIFPNYICSLNISLPPITSWKRSPGAIDPRTIDDRKRLKFARKDPLAGCPFAEVTV